MIHYMLLLGYILVTCHKNNIVTLHVTFMLYRRNKTCLLGLLFRFPKSTANQSRCINTIEILWLTPYGSWCTTFDFIMALSAPPLHRGSEPELKFFSYHRWSRYHSYGKRVTDSSQAVIISFVPTSFKSPHYLRPMRARDTAYFESYATDVFITPCLSLCSVEGC